MGPTRWLVVRPSLKAEGLCSPRLRWDLCIVMVREVGEAILKFGAAVASSPLIVRVSTRALDFSALKGDA